MSHVVTKAFKTVNRKFKPGDVVTTADIDGGSAFTLADWVARGFVATEAAPKAPSASKNVGLE